MPKTGDLRQIHCEHCGKTTEFYYDSPYPQTRETPEEPGGWQCQECDEYAPDPDEGDDGYGDYLYEAEKDRQMDLYFADKEKK